MPYQDEPVVDWSVGEKAVILKENLQAVRRQFGKTYPLVINAEFIYYSFGGRWRKGRVGGVTFECLDLYCDVEIHTLTGLSERFGNALY